MTKEDKDPTFFQLVHSILAAFIGVQNKENYERDNAFIEKKGIKYYVIIGFTFAFLFHVVLYFLVKFVISIAS